jgi:PAS domain S-box-containing protein
MMERVDARLRLKVLLTIGVAFAGIFILLFVTAFTILLGGFGRLEEGSANVNTRRAANVLMEDHTELEHLIRPWSSWDAAYRYLQKPDAEFPQRYRYLAQYQDLPVDLIVFLDSLGKVVFVPATRRSGERGGALPPDFTSQLGSGGALFGTAAAPFRGKGLLTLQEGTILLVSRPILTSDGEGPPQGMVIMGRFLTPERIAEVERISHLQLKVVPLHDPSVPDAVRTRFRGAEAADFMALPEGPETMRGFYCLRDVNGRPATVVRASMSRDIYRQGQATVRLFVVSLVSMGIILMAVSLILLNRTIEGRLLAEAALRESQRHYRSLFNDSRAVMLLVDPITGEIIDANGAACRFYGCDAEGRCSHTIGEITALPVAEVQAEVERAREEGRDYLLLRHRLFNGEIRDVEVYQSPLTLGGRGLLFSIVHDVSQRRRAEEALRESEEMFRSLAEESPNMIFINDFRRIVYVNRRCVEMMGYSREEFGAPGFTFLSLVAPEDHGRLQGNFRRHQQGQDVGQVEYTLVTRDGRRLPAILGTKLISFQSSPSILGIVTDITERKRSEELLRNALREIEIQNENLRKLDRIKDGLIRDVSHELKTPVAKHAMQMELLKRLLADSNLQDRAASILRVMDSSIRRQESVIRNILDLARLEGGGRKYQFGLLRLDEAVQKVLEDYRHDFSVHGMEARASLVPVEVTSDQQMVWHVLSNIVTNAIKFRSPEAPPVLDVTLAVDAGGAVLTLTDNGIGLGEEEKERVFDRFFKGNPSLEGSGIGLSIVKTILDDLGVGIVINSPGKGKGVTVTLRFPGARTPL